MAQTADKAAQRGGRGTGNGPEYECRPEYEYGPEYFEYRPECTTANRNPNGKSEVNTGNAAATVRKTVPAGNDHE